MTTGNFAFLMQSQQAKGSQGTMTLGISPSDAVPAGEQPRPNDDWGFRLPMEFQQTKSNQGIMTTGGFAF
jgi:hypothetical protein